jgi:CRISPR/Cas system-associated exonuclease Cas4 (RecB family)
VSDPASIVPAMLRRGRSWVCKTDVTRYVRCPYAFWLLDRGLISFADTVSEFQAQLLAGGIVFESVVASSAVPVTVAPGDIGGLLREDVRLLGTPDFENRRLRIRGRPDGIDSAGGALYPIEIKSHSRVTRLDELELAFYWLLLAPYRTQVDATPRGLLILREDGRASLAEVLISPDRLEEVRRLVRAVRDARRKGVQPRVCGCQVCSVAREMRSAGLCGSAGTSR